MTKKWKPNKTDIYTIALLIAFCSFVFVVMLFQSHASEPFSFSGMFSLSNFRETVVDLVIVIAIIALFAILVSRRFFGGRGQRKGKEGEGSE